MIRVYWMLLFLVLSSSAVGQPGDPDDIVCDDPAYFSSWSHYLCNFPGQSIYVPNNVALSYPVSFLVPYWLPGNNSIRLRLFFGGYNPSGSVCTTRGYTEPGFIVIKNCPGHYPNIYDYTVDGVVPYGWWGQFFGDSNGHRIAVSLSKASGQWSASIDQMAGIMLKGQSYGGTGSILQSVMLPDPAWQSQISIVWAQIPRTLFVAPDPVPGNGIHEGGLYWYSARVQLAWGSYDPDNADIIKQADSVRHIYYRLNGSPVEGEGFDLDFFRDLCDARKVACFGTWHSDGHKIAESGVNLPFYDLHSSPDMDVRLDQILPVFTNSTANHWGPRGHFNLGLEWAHGDTFVDTADIISVPIRYRRRTSMGGEIPDQPISATFDVTLRRVKNIDLSPGTQYAWVFGNQSGFSSASQGAVTVKGLTLESSTEYTELQMTFNAPPSVGC
jgi:hypothetical protein